MEANFYADILFFAALAGFILYRLYSVLGRKDGTEQNITHRVKEFWDAKAKEAEAKLEKKQAAPAAMKDVTPAPKQKPVTFADVAEGARPSIQQLTEKDKQFTPERFMEGAKAAFEIILMAFAEGDKITLQRLVEPSMFAEFESDIDRRISSQETMSTSLVALVRAEITQAKLEGKIATITVAFESEQISVTKNAAGEVISGDASRSERLHDAWVFERDISSRNPSWMLIDIID